MEAIQQVQAFFSSSYSVIAAVAAVLAVLFKIFGHLGRALELRDKHFIHKRLARLKAIRPSAANNTPLTQYLDAAIELEVFRIASGINTSRVKMEYLLQLNQLGRWSRGQLRSISKFLAVEPGDPAPQLSVTTFERVGACISGFAAGSVLLLSTIQLVRFFITGQPLLWLLGLALFALGIIAARFLATDLLDYLIVRRATKHLELSAKASD